jgi:uncharacterized protein
MTRIDKQGLPSLGVGLSFRPEIANELYSCVDELDCVEVILDTAISGILDERFWTMVAAKTPMLGHGVDLSIGSLDDLDSNYLARISSVVRRMKCRWFSDHLAFTHSDDVEVGQLTPLQFTAKNADFIAKKVRCATELLGVPFLVENIAYYFPIPGATMTEGDFIVRILEGSGCGLLLDAHNLYANSINHGYDPRSFIDKVPAEAVVEVHVAGGAWKNDLYLDSHGHAVPSEVFDLVDYVIATKHPRAVILEREKNFPSTEVLLSEVNELRNIWRKHQSMPRQVAVATGNGRFS